MFGGGGTRPPHNGQGKTPSLAKREREVYDRTAHGSIEAHVRRAAPSIVLNRDTEARQVRSSTRTRRSRTIDVAWRASPKRSPRAATTSSGRPVPSSGWNRVRVR